MRIMKYFKGVDVGRAVNVLSLRSGEGGGQETDSGWEIARWNRFYDPIRARMFIFYEIVELERSGIYLKKEQSK